MTTPAVIKAPQVFAKTAVKVRSPSLSPFFFLFVSVFLFAPTRGVLATRACSRT